MIKKEVVISELLTSQLMQLIRVLYNVQVANQLKVLKVKALKVHQASKDQLQEIDDPKRVDPKSLVHCQTLQKASRNLAVRPLANAMNPSSPDPPQNSRKVTRPSLKSPRTPLKRLALASEIHRMFTMLSLSSLLPLKAESRHITHTRLTRTHTWLTRTC